mmetsp:Transcript_8576/g.26835  ORF Transcript_8576/g.26835 Transcript_8576/m.26835 type:complete len:275 (-) Transcript_8576:1306-2130(-)
MVRRARRAATSRPGPRRRGGASGPSRRSADDAQRLLVRLRQGRLAAPFFALAPHVRGAARLRTNLRARAGQRRRYRRLARELRRVARPLGPRGAGRAGRRRRARRSAAGGPRGGLARGDGGAAIAARRRLPRPVLPCRRLQRQPRHEDRKARRLRHVPRRHHRDAPPHGPTRVPRAGVRVPPAIRRGLRCHLRDGQRPRSTDHSGRRASDMARGGRPSPGSCFRRAERLRRLSVPGDSAQAAARRGRRQHEAQRPVLWVPRRRLARVWDRALAL